MYDNDGLHPSIAGYEAMGNAVDLSLFYHTMSDADRLQLSPAFTE